MNGYQPGRIGMAMTPAKNMKEHLKAMGMKKKLKPGKKGVMREKP